MNLTRTQEELLDYASSMEYKSINIYNDRADNSAALEFELKPNEVMFVEIFPASPASEKLPEGTDEALWNQQMSATSKQQ